jgi:deoxyadenosine/deoxycytidine kinase
MAVESPQWAEALGLQGESLNDAANCVLRVDAEDARSWPSAKLLQEVAQDLARHNPDPSSGFSWEAFIQEGVERWEGSVPRPLGREASRPSAEELTALSWSPLVPELLCEPEKLAGLIDRAWDAYEGYSQQDPEDQGGFGVVVGTMATGKSSLTRALAGGRPLETEYSAEEWEDNQDLAIFYALLTLCVDPHHQQNEIFPNLKGALRHVQAKAQSWFSARKFVQYLRAAEKMANGIFVIQDTPIEQDMVYQVTQSMMGLTTEEGQEHYQQDNDLRQRLLPPNLRAPEVLVGLWAPYETMKARIISIRGRDFEVSMPPGYLLTLYSNTIQWMMAMNQAGVPTVLVDSSAGDFTPGQITRPIIVEKIWKEIDQIRAEQH